MATAKRRKRKTKPLQASAFKKARQATRSRAVDAIWEWQEAGKYQHNQI